MPYAAPPVAERRWLPPAPFAGSEDCLTLEVFAPRQARAARLPVMVWVHGGANLWGNGADFDGSRLAAAHDVVVIFNYRLGPFGWFHHPAITEAQTDTPRTGQFAILDMIAVLRWVSRNIAAFGGDPRNVALFGESAGAQNVYVTIPSRGRRRAPARSSPW